MESEMDFDDKKFYMNYLDGLTDDMPDEFFRLAQVFELNLFEPVRIDGSSDIYAAYIMNDAVESFFVFEQPVITGTYKDIESEQIAGVEKLDDGYMLIVNQGETSGKDCADGVSPAPVSGAGSGTVPSAPTRSRSSAYTAATVSPFSSARTVRPSARLSCLTV